MRDRWRRFRRGPATLGSTLFVLLLVVVALGAERVAPHRPLAMSTHIFVPPSAAYPLGTDQLGRDVLSGLVYGARVSLEVGVAAAAAATLFGILAGTLAGYYGGVMDALLMRTSEFFQVLPTFVLAALLVALWGPGLTRIVGVIAVLAWPRTARLTRGEVMRLKQREFVAAVRCLGMSDGRIIGREILPNALPPVIATGALIVGQAILLEASLSFLGLSSPDLVSWGVLLNSGQRFLFSAWWLSFFPGMAILATVLAFNLIADGIIDALNPRLVRR